MRVAFGHYAKWIMGFMFVAMVVTTFSWNGLGRGNTNAGAASQQNPDETVATVDGEQISRSDFNDMMQRMQQSIGGGSVPLMQRGFFRTYALGQLETTYETLAKAKSMGITATDADVQAEREKALKTQDGRKQLSLPETATLAEVDAALQQHGTSLDRIYPESELKIAIIMTKLQDKVKKGVIVTEQDARDSFTQYHTRHILIDNKKRSDVQAQNLGKQILAKALAPGADFAALAKQVSDDPGTKAKGGDDGFIDTKTPYVDEFKTAAFALKPGQITTDLVKSPQFGYFIIKCDEVKSKLPKDFDKNKAKYISDLANTKQSEAMTKFSQDLQAAPHNIVMIDPQLKADKEFQDAQRLSPPDAVKQSAMYNQAIADYTKALKSASAGQDKALIYIQIANAYQAQKNTTAQTTALEQALVANGSDEPNLLVALGDLYKDAKNNTKALDYYNRASKAAWTDVNVHQQLAGDFDKLGSKDLGDKERAWLADYQKNHPQPKNPMMSMGGGQPINVSPSGGKISAHPIKVAPAVDSSTPPAVTVKPAAGAPAAQPVKPAQ